MIDQIADLPRRSFDIIMMGIIMITTSMMMIMILISIWSVLCSQMAIILLVMSIIDIMELSNVVGVEINGRADILGREKCRHVEDVKKRVFRCQ